MSTLTSFSRASSCVHSVGTDIRRNEVRVVFNNRSHYLYRNVPTHAIKELLTNADISLGRWVYNNCVNADSVQVIKLK